MGNAKRQTVSPSAEMIVQLSTHALQPLPSARAAKRGVATDAPIYVQELSIPEKVDTLPLFANLLGAIEISIRFMPCIQAMIKVTRSVDISADGASVSHIYISTPNSIAAPNMTVAQKTSFFSSLR